MTQKKYKKENKNTPLNEPLVDYGDEYQNKTIVISSVKEQEESNYNYWLSLTPIQRLEAHYKLITALYKDELKKNKDTYDKTIIIDEYPDRQA